MKHQPCDEAKMHQKNPTETICEVLREIYWLTDDETIRYKLRRATTMAKGMDGKLRQYKADWDKDYWNGSQSD